ncbi:hypothetical protein V0288_17655 [Pannus brasiliensis CCIBt3594]|uniref:Uncharacterized protein n=1 Tax=Pannus brasiliensis CCIBt3594 TaxID=1427578 RepID=A0AAW9QVB6_9CHRO
MITGFGRSSAGDSFCRRREEAGGRGQEEKVFFKNPDWKADGLAL